MKRTKWSTELWRFRLAVAALAAAAVTPACQTTHPPSLETGSRLLALDALDAGADHLELIGLSRFSEPGMIGFSIEFLDLREDLAPEITLELDLWPDAGSPSRDGDWDLRLRAEPGSNPALSVNAPLNETSLPINIHWDFKRDLVTLTFTGLESMRSAPSLIRVSVGEPGASLPADEIGPIPSDARETRFARLHLAFWDVFAAGTPAQALRSWDGAHSGPAGERFGLRYLLRAVRSYAVPVTLLDVKSPSNLSGLAYLDQLEDLRNLQTEGLLYLPESLPEGYDPARYPAALTERILHDRRTMALAFGLQPSQWVSLQLPELSHAGGKALETANVRGVLLRNPDPAARGPGFYLRQTGKLRIAPLPRTETALSAGEDGGLGIEWRRALLQAALRGEEGNEVILGGSLAETFWADPLLSDQNFSWLAARPWIEVEPLENLERGLSAAQHVHLPDHDGETPPQAQVEPGSLLSLGTGPIPDLAIDLLVRTTARTACLPVDDLRMDDEWRRCRPEVEAALNDLRRLASPAAAMFAIAAEWADSVACAEPAPGLEIDTLDFDDDGLDEAVMKNGLMLAFVDPQGGRLAGLFACRPESPPTVIVAPRSVAGIGLSDPTEWSFERGEIGEWTAPLLAGGVVSPTDAETLFNLTPTHDGLTVSHPQGIYRIDYRLEPGTLRILITAASGGVRTFEIPLLFPPERLRSPGFMQDLIFFESEDQILLGFDPGIQVRIEVLAPSWHIEGFHESPVPLLSAEDPNLEAPPGHYLPFPFALLTVAAGSGNPAGIAISLE